MHMYAYLQSHIQIITEHSSKQIAPGADDIRGPCPGLNTLANHGYISRSGVDSVLAIKTASNEGKDGIRNMPSDIELTRSQCLAWALTWPHFYQSTLVLWQATLPLSLLVESQRVVVC